PSCSRSRRRSRRSSDPVDCFAFTNVLRARNSKRNPYAISMSQLQLSQFARGLTAETAFDVLAVAKKLKAAGKDVIELQIGDSPFPGSKSAIAAGKRAIDEGATHYCSSMGLPEFRETIARNYLREFGVKIGPENVVVGPGAKVFEQFFCEA